MRRGPSRIADSAAVVVAAADSAVAAAGRVVAAAVVAGVPAVAAVAAADAANLAGKFPRIYLKYPEYAEGRRVLLRTLSYLAKSPLLTPFVDTVTTVDGVQRAQTEVLNA
jgi:hypothetical protein